jgi:hypothetical protein
MKRFLTYIIVIITFCLTVLPASANTPNERKLKVYPNPIERNAVLKIELPASDNNNLTVILYNPVGKVIQTLKTTSKTIEFNAPDISGIYLLRIIENQKVIAVEKIVVKE